MGRTCRQLSSGSRHPAQCAARVGRGSLPLKRFAAAGVLFASLLSGASVPAQQLDLYFKTSPATERLRPYSEPATLSLLATASDGKPVASGWVTIELEAPPRGRIFSTDFPWVEGSKLHKLRLPLKAGKAEWKYLFPIRGQYRLAVDVDTAEGRTAGKVFYFTIRENRLKWLTLGVFILALFLLGFIAGRIFSSRATLGRGAAVFLIFAVIMISPGNLAAAQDLSAGPTGRLEISPATVGRTTQINWKLEDGKTDAKPAALLSLSITHLEKEKIVFAVDRLAVVRDYSIDFQFTDGAEYRVTAYAEIPGAKPIRTEETVSVTGLEPPLGAMVPPIICFLLVIAGGLAAGRWSRKRARSNRAGYFSETSINTPSGSDI